MKYSLLYACAALMLAGTTASGQGIRIMPGTTFKHTGGAYNLVLAGGAHFENNAAVQTANLTIKATGSGNSDLKGTAPLQVARLLVNKAPGQNIVLQKDITVGTNVSFTSGLVNLNSHILMLGDTALLVNESETSRITGSTGGSVMVIRNLNSPLAENPGNLGLVITSGANWGNTQIKRGHAVFPTAGAGGNITRSFEITPTNNSGLNSFLRAYYFDAELNALDENNLDFYQSANGGTVWTNIGSASRNTAQNFVNINGIQQVSLLTLSTISSPLPLYMAAIRATCLNNRPELQWRLEYISDATFFQVQKSRDSKEWQSLEGTIKVERSTDHEYHYTDITEPYPFYRLQCISVDNSIYYSPVLPVNCQDASYAFRLLQNPVQGSLRIGVDAKANINAKLQATDMAGRVLLVRELNIQPGSSSQEYDLHGFAAGMYQLQVTANNQVLWQAKFVNQ